MRGMLFCYPLFLYLFVSQLLVKNGYAVLLLCCFVGLRFLGYAALLMCCFVGLRFCDYVVLFAMRFCGCAFCWFAVLWLGIGTVICLEDCVAFDVGGLSIWL